MSQYGRLWQQASDLRREIQEALSCPLPHDYKPIDVRARIAKMEKLAAQWEALEETMRQTDD